MTTIYTGLDIAKLNLQLHLLGRRHDLPNTAAGHRRLVKLWLPCLERMSSAKPPAVTNATSSPPCMTPASLSAS